MTDPAIRAVFRWTLMVMAVAAQTAVVVAAW